MGFDLNDAARDGGGFITRKYIPKPSANPSPPGRNNYAPAGVPGSWERGQNGEFSNFIEGARYDQEAAESLGTRAAPNGQDSKPAVFRRIINPSDWEGAPIPARNWIVQEFIPAGTVTLLYGDGATGKSLLALQLCAAMALAREWIGLLPEPGRTLLLSAEDEGDEMHRRVEDIRKFYNCRMADLSDIRLVDLVGEDSILAGLVKGQIEAAAMYRTLDAYLAEWEPRLAILDVLADMFGGDENNRVHARQFVGLLKRLCRKHDCAFLLLAHPSLTGINTGTGTSGSTGWGNSVRSRLYFQIAKTKDGDEPDKTLRTLEAMKSNYGAVGAVLTLKWDKGLFVPVHGTAGLDKLVLDAKADEVFVNLLNRLTCQKRNVSDRKGTSYAPALFADEPDAVGVTKKAFEGAMRRLLKAATIHVEEFGPPSHRRTKLAPGAAP